MNRIECHQEQIHSWVDYQRGYHSGYQACLRHGEINREGARKASVLVTFLFMGSLLFIGFLLGLCF